jgi:hypothetical protein
MSALYHIVPPIMVGTRIVPLSSLKSLSLSLFEVAAEKYSNRPNVPLQRIPPLDCMWNDVVFLTAVPPQKIVRAYESCGARLIKRRFYRIDPSKLNQAKATIWNAESSSKSEEDFSPFDAETLESYGEIPQKTLEYYRRMMAEGRRREMLIFAHVPHILYRGEIDVSDAEIVEV